MVVFQRGGLSSGRSFHRVVSHQGGLSTGWSLIMVVFQQCGLSSGWSFNRVLSHQGGLSTGWSLTRVFFPQGSFSSGWSFNRVVSGWVLIQPCQDKILAYSPVLATYPPTPPLHPTHPPCQITTTNKKIMISFVLLSGACKITAGTRNCSPS